MEYLERKCTRASDPFLTTFEQHNRVRIIRVGLEATLLCGESHYRGMARFFQAPCFKLRLFVFYFGVLKYLINCLLFISHMNGIFTLGFRIRNASWSYLQR